MIPRETVDLILDSARIEDVVGDFVALKRRGANYVACCPFHNEKTPSFYVSPAKGLYKCFGCGKAGNALRFVMEHESMSYVEALRYLAKKYNIEVVEEEESAEEIMQRQLRESLFLVSEFACRFFASQLESGEGRSVGYAYFKSRGLDDETISRFSLGWAPSGRTALVDAARAAGYKDEYILGAGLAVRKEDGTIADKFRERVMFPIHSVSGRVVAFSGRTLHSDNPAKYVNSPETDIYIKSRNLLGIYFAKSEMVRLGKCILVEGNVDMVTMHQLGIRNAVASCGTSLTVEQIRLIRKFTENVTIMYDGDSAGIHAALRGINLVLSEGLNVKVVLLPDGEDPDSYCRKHSLAEVQDFIASSERDFIEFKSDLLLEEAGKDPLKKANLINDVADSIAEIPDPVKRSVYASSCAARFGIESDIVFGRINSVRRKKISDSRTLRSSETAATDVRQESVPVVTVREEDAWDLENRTLAKAERELLSFILRNGTDLLDFSTDSDYYSGSEDDKPTVSDFIRISLESDGSAFQNSAYRKTYDAYMEGYDEGLDQQQILSRLLNSPDRLVANVATELSIEKYDLSVERFRASMTTTPSWLVKYVPKTLLYYSERRIQDSIDSLRRSLTDPSADVEDVMRKIIRLQASHRIVKTKLGRENNH